MLTRTDKCVIFGIACMRTSVMDGNVNNPIEEIMHRRLPDLYSLEILVLCDLQLCICSKNGKQFCNKTALSFIHSSVPVEVNSKLVDTHQKSKEKSFS